MKTMFKKSVFAALSLAALSSYAVEWGDDDYEWQQKNKWLVVKQDCSLSDIVNLWGTKHEATDMDQEYIIRVENSIITVDSDILLPSIGELDFIGDCQLVYNGLYTVTANSDSEQGILPMIYIGQQAYEVKANLAITFSDTAIKSALQGQALDNIYTHDLVKGCMFYVDRNINPPNTYSFEFGDASLGGVYVYNDTQSYQNVGLIPSVDALKRNTAAIYVQGEPLDVGNGSFAMGTMTVAFVGSQYVAPAPEPTTGALSLLALAGLAARRRRK